MSSTVWIKLTSFTHSRRSDSQLIAINDVEFAVWSQGKKDKIHKYNIYSDEWDQWIKIPHLESLGGGHIGGLVFDKNQCKLYIHFKTAFIVFNTNTKQYKIYKNVTDGQLGEGIFIDDKCHIIGGFRNKHLIWNEKKEIFDQQHEFNDFPHIWGHELIHLKSKKMLLCIGGWDAAGPAVLNTLNSFNLHTSKWSKLQQTLPNNLMYFGCAGSRNDQFILIFGGKEGIPDSSKTDKIHILNTKTMTFRESAIKCPIKAEFRAINMNNPKKEELLNCGYIRYLWSLPQFDHIMYPPFYLIQIIGKYFSLEMIHLLSLDTIKNGHWKINMDEIIANC